MPTLSDIGAQPDQPAKPAKGQSAPTPNHYCLENTHDPRLLTEARMFYFDEAAGCPECPVCGRQVSAQRVEYDSKGQPQIPRNLLSLADRIGERV